jgi:hypothetical protein
MHYAKGQVCLTIYLNSAIVEQVRDGSSIRVRLLLEDGSHQFVNLVSLIRTSDIPLLLDQYSLIVPSWSKIAKSL